MVVATNVEAGCTGTARFSDSGSSRHNHTETTGCPTSNLYSTRAHP